MASLTSSEISTCVEILNKLTPGFLPKDIFHALARLMRLSVVNLIPVRNTENGIEIGLARRRPDDTFWPNMWNLPGTVFRPTDTIQSVFKRLTAEEIGVRTANEPQFQTFATFTGERGTGIALIYTLDNCQLNKTSPISWFNLHSLPDDLIVGEKYIIDAWQQHLKT